MGAILLWRWRQQECRSYPWCCQWPRLRGLPFPAVTFLTKRAATVPTSSCRQVHSGREPSQVPRPQSVESIQAADNGWVMHRFGRGFTGNRYLRLYVLAMAVALAMMIQKEREACLILGSAVSVAAWLHVPPLCTLLLKAGGAEWMVLRLGSIMDVLFAALCSGCGGGRGGEGSCSELCPSGVPHIGVPLVIQHVLPLPGAFFASHNGPYTWKSYLQRGDRQGVRYGTQLNPLRRLSDDLKAWSRRMRWFLPTLRLV